MYSSPLPDSTTLSAANLDVGRTTVEVPCRSLQSLMRELGHDRIDLLKYHVEGSRVRGLRPGAAHGAERQDPRYPAVPHRPAAQGAHLISDIVARGYAPVAHAGSAFTFLRSDLFAAPRATGPRRRSAPVRSRRVPAAGARRQEADGVTARPARDRASDSAGGPSTR